jgi:hypothetical protein
MPSAAPMRLFQLGSGDHMYAIDKLKQAAAIDLTNPDIMINMGINYLKMGGENGGEAVKAYQDATLQGS